MLNLDILINSKIPEIWNPSLNKFMLFITHMGGGLFIVTLSFLIIIYLFYKKKYSKLILLFIGIAGGIILRTLIKISVKRIRPENSLVSETGYSFPSGHALLSIIFFLLLIYIFKDEIKIKSLKIIFITINIILILFVSFSRIYLNVHWFSDVFGGILIGIAWTIISILITTKFINPKILKT
ncbi:MAG: phosphatase PAP2 family protein [Candidatus Pacearchaeota archaeon]|jgi:undecaprenyl-diphosphatase